MTEKNNLTTSRLNAGSLLKRMVLGAVTGLVIISVFVFSVDQPKPEWGKLWMIKPLIVTPLVGAIGSLIFYSISLIHFQRSWKNIVAMIFGVIVFIVALWLGIVLGLNGTLWD
jgi:hypothetical protein